MKIQQGIKIKYDDSTKYHRYLVEIHVTFHLQLSLFLFLLLLLHW
jgi:hypothetical protein